MCLPLAVAAAGVAAAGQLLGGVGAMQQGNYQAAIARRNAGMDEDAARDSRTQGQIEARNFFRQVAQTKGDQIAAMAANGVDLGFGSPLRVQEDAQQGEREDAANLYHNTEQRTKGFFIDAMNARAEGAAAKSQGRAALVGSIFKAGSSLMSGFQQQAALKGKLGFTKSDASSLIRAHPGVF